MNSPDELSIIRDDTQTSAANGTAQAREADGEPADEQQDEARESSPRCRTRNLSANSGTSVAVSERLSPYGLQNGDALAFPGEFDVITVHGIHGGREDTWKARDQSKCGDFPGIHDLQANFNCRVMNYGYDPLGDGAKIFSKRGIVAEASKLLSEIAESRKKARRDHPRAIVFAAHDLGGTIVKQALIQAASDPGFGDIASSTKALVFFACVHRYDDLHDLEDGIARLVFSGSKIPTPNTLLNVRSLAMAIVEVNDAFADCKAMLRAKLTNVYSTSTEPAERIFDQYSATTGLGLESNVGVSEPHAYIACAPADTKAWARIVEAFEYGSDFFRGGNDTDADRLQPREHAVQDMLVSLSWPMQPNLRASESQDQVSWVKAHEKFVKWHRNSSSDVLIIRGAGDSGHTSAQLHESISLARSNVDLTAYFSFDRHDARRRNMRNFFDTTIAQWICQRPELSESCGWDFEYRRYADFRSYTALDALYVLTKMRIFNVFMQQTIFVLDNTDQCLDLGAWFWEHFASLFARTETPFKFIVFAGPHEDTHEWLKHWPVIDLAERGHPGSAPLLATGGPDRPNHMPADLRSRLIRQCGSDQALLHFVADQLRRVDCTTLAGPSGDAGCSLLEAFLQLVVDHHMRRTPEEDRPMAVGILSWLLHGFRPITRGELRSYVLMEGSASRCGSFRHLQCADMEAFTRLIEGSLPGMLELCRQEIRWRHPSLRTFFQQASGVWYATSNTAHATIAQSCLKYLSSDAGRRALTELPAPDDSVFATMVYKPRENIAVYAAEYWQEHYRLAIDKTELLGQAMEFLRDESALWTWANVRWFISNPLTRPERGNPSPLPLAASLGLPDVLEECLRDWANSPCIGELKSRALVEAARAGHRSSVRYLLHSIDNDPVAAETVLRAAIGYGDEDLLLELVSYVSRRLENFDWPPVLICRAAWLGQIRLLTLLVQKGARLKVKEEVFAQQTPFHLAVRHGHLEAAELLIVQDPTLAQDVSIISDLNLDIRTTPLGIASSHGQPDAVSLILNAGSGPDEIAEDDWRPITTACFDGRLSVLNVLLDHGAEIDFEYKGSRGWPALPCAVDNGFFRCAEVLLDHGAQVDIKAPGGTALYIAIVNADAKMCRLLLDRGADPDYEGYNGHALVVAARGNNPELVRLLVEKGASVDKRMDGDGLTALHTAICHNASVEVVRYLLDRGADANARTPSGSAILDACFNDATEIARLLIEKKADLEMPNDDGWAPLHAAYKSPSMTRILLENGADVNSVAGTGKSPLYVAAEQNRAETVDVLLEFRPDINKQCEAEEASPVTALVVAVRSGSTDVARKLLEAGGDVNYMSPAGLLTMEYASEDEMRNLLLDFHPDLGLEDDFGDTVLHDYLAVRGPQLPFVKALFCEGVDIHKPNANGMTPLCLAVEGNYADIARFFLKHGADAAVSHVRAGSPLHMACSNGCLEIVKLLLEASADPTAVHRIFGNAVSAACMGTTTDEDAVEATVNFLVESSERKIDLNGTGGLYGFPLSAAAFCQTVPVIDLLVRAGARADVQDAMGRAPIHFAAYRDIAMFDRLCEARADLSVRDKMGRTVAHCAVQSGDLALVKHILKGARELLNARDVHGWTPLHYAARGCCHLTHKRNIEGRRRGDAAQPAIVAYLVDAGSDVWARSSDRPWSPLMLARYHGAAPETLELLKPQQDEDGLGRWDDELHQIQRAAEQDSFCDSCFAPVEGIRYKCTDYVLIDLCYKCYSLRETLHPGHNWDSSGPEFADLSTTTSSLTSEKDIAVESGTDVESSRYAYSSSASETLSSGDES